MNRSSFSEVQIIRILKEQEAGIPTVEAPDGAQCDVAKRPADADRANAGLRAQMGRGGALDRS